MEIKGQIHPNYCRSVCHNFSGDENEQQAEGIAFGEAVYTNQDADFNRYRPKRLFQAGERNPILHL